MSHIGLIQRVQKTKENKYGVKRISTIPDDEVCVLYLGGNKTDSEQAASGNAKIIEYDILPYLPTDIPVYSAYYDVGIDNMWFDWGANFSKYGYNFLTASKDSDDFVWINEKNIKNVFATKILPKIINRTGKLLGLETIKSKFETTHIIFDGYFYGLRNKLNQMLKEDLTKRGIGSKDLSSIIKCITNHSYAAKDLDSEYINTLFEKTVLPRISAHGKRLALNVAMARVRKINIVAHCHGTYLVQKLEEKMRTSMHNFGYSATEINQILSQMLVIAHAPIIPLGVSKFRIISFTTAADHFAERPKNWLTEYVKYMQKQEKDGEIDANWLSPCFLSGRNGDVFIINNAFEPNANGNPHAGEHRIARYLPVEGQTLHGELMGAIAGNILINGIKNSLGKEFTPLPPTKELVLGEKEQEGMKILFEELKANGRKFMKDVFKFATDNFKEKHVQRPIRKLPEIKR